MYQGPLMPFLPVEITAPFSQENAGTRTAAGVCDAGMSVCQVSPFQLNPCAGVRLSKGTKFSVHDERESLSFYVRNYLPWSFLVLRFKGQHI